MSATHAITPALPIIAIALWMMGGYQEKGWDTTDRVNAIIGDVSYYEQFGSLPDAACENQRIGTHLKYVEHSLRMNVPADIGREKLERRQHLLDLLQVYRQAGVFPRNTVAPDKRVPCFIDPDGRICAVGYLIEHTAGRAEAKRINSLFQYEKLLDMHDPHLAFWIERSGFTPLELAMIQPQYGHHPRRGHYGTGLATSVLTVANLNMNVCNAIQIVNKGLPEKNTHKAGFWTGGAQLVLGATMHVNASDTQRKVSIFNMVMGATTLATSFWSMQSSPPGSGSTWEPFVADHPMLEGASVFGVHFTHRF